jgi:hypothetical protein
VAISAPVGFAKRALWQRVREMSRLATASMRKHYGLADYLAVLSRVSACLSAHPEPLGLERMNGARLSLLFIVLPDLIEIARARRPLPGRQAGGKIISITEAGFL